MTKPFFRPRHAALAAVMVCLIAVLQLLDVNNPWVVILVGLGLGIVWTIAEMVVEEIQGRKKLHDEAKAREQRS
jgi:hypothetical protein